MAGRRRTDHTPSVPVDQAAVDGAPDRGLDLQLIAVAQDLVDGVRGDEPVRSRENCTEIDEELAGTGTYQIGSKSWQSWSAHATDLHF